MRKLTVILLALMITLCSAVPAFASWKDTIKNTAENTYDAAKQMTSIAKDAIVGGVEVEVNGDKVSFPDQEPFIDSEKNRTYVPLRFVSEALGGKVDWKPEKEIATVERDGKNVEMPIGSNTPTVDGQEKKLDAPAELMNERTVVPLRFVSEALGADVEWIGEERLVKITDKDVSEPEEPDEPSGNTYTINGYEIPKDHEMDIDTNDPDENPHNFEIGIQYSVEDFGDVSGDVDKHLEDVYHILSSKFGSKAGQVIDIVEQKNSEDDGFDEWIEINNQEMHIYSGKTDPYVYIDIWAEGV